MPLRKSGGSTTKPTDWRRELQAVQSDKALSPFEKYWDDPGKELLKRGTRTSRYSEGGFRDDGPVDLDHVLRMMSINLQDRIKNAKKKQPSTIDIRTRAQKMKGLFGGG